MINNQILALSSISLLISGLRVIAQQPQQQATVVPTVTYTSGDRQAQVPDYLSSM
jgi:hypothetical protein